MEHEDYMREALYLAREAAQRRGARRLVIVKDGEIIGRGRNRREELQRTSRTQRWKPSHRQMNVCALARLDGCALRLTLRPCPMCAGAIVNAHPARPAGARDEALRRLRLAC